MKSLLMSALLVSVVAAPLLAAPGDVRLIDAIKAQDRPAVQTLLKQRVDVNAAEGDGSTALHWAAHRNDLDLVRQLISLGANVNAATDLKVTPLSLACLNGNGAIVERLLDAGANPNVMMTGESALMTAARTGSVSVVRALVVKGADVNAREPNRLQTALMWAASQRHSDIVRLLIEAGADIHARSRSYPIRVNYGGQSNSGGDPNNPITLGDTMRGGSTALLFAARSGDVESARLLLAAGANVNDELPDGMSALTLAARSGRTEMAKLLIERGANPNANGTGYTPLHVAVLVGDFDVVAALIARGADPNIPLTKAAPVRRGNQELSLPVAVLGATPFLLAAKFADLPTLRALAAAGGNISIPMKNGTTPLMAAAGFGAGGGGNRRGVGNRYQNNYIAADAETDTLEAVKLLIEMGADVNEGDPAGNTALFGAVAQGYDSVVEYLVSKGAKIDVKNKRGQTLLALTRPGRDSDGRKSTAELLRKLGAIE